MPDALDPLPLLRALHERGIEHIVVGGFAVNAHGFIRVTKDLYGELSPDAIEGEVDGIPVRVCSLEHLRAMKRAAGRPQDLEDLRRLGEA
jgi:predicted nucleotidyltransferase